MKEKVGTVTLTVERQEKMKEQERSSLRMVKNVKSCPNEWNSDEPLFLSMADRGTGDLVV